MATRKEEQVQRGHYFAIVDEVDSILIDEARTPLIISGPSVHTHGRAIRQWKPLVDSLVRAQEKLCARFLSEAEALIKKLRPRTAPMSNAGELEHEIGLLLFRVKTGQPKIRGLDENSGEPGNPPDEPGGTGLHKDQKQRWTFTREKEELLFAMDEKSHEADLDGKGPQFHQPEGPGRVRAAGFDTLLHDVDRAPETDARKRLERRPSCRRISRPRRRKIHAISQLLKAYSLYQLDVEYVVQENKVIIVDQHTGPPHARPPLERRLAPGRRGQGRRGRSSARRRRWPPSRSRIISVFTETGGHDRHGGNRGHGISRHLQARRADIPTNKPNIRKDANDSVYKTRREKFNAVVKEIKTIHATWAGPILVGTVSVETSEMLSRMLKKEGHHSFRAQRQISPAGGRNRRARRPARRRHHRHQHGRSRHGHQTRRRRRGVGGLHVSAPSATNRGALTASCADVARARAIPVPRTFSFRWRTI
jgi:preprotein translocase subunit SecA